jgi:mono/diheme cytochrome c family protein
MTKARKELTRTIGITLLVFASGALAFAAHQSSPQPASKPTPPVYTAAEIRSGREIFVKQCEVCHFPNSKAKKIGPGLAKIYPGGKFANGKMVDDVSMRLWIEAGGKDMPAFKSALKPEEIRDLIAYLRTL